MVSFLGPTPSVKAILDKPDSMYGSVSTFDVMMQGFYRESQGRSKSVTYYVARLEGKLKEISVKHLNKVSEAEAAGYIQDHLFYGLRKLFQESIHTQLYNTLNNYMSLMQAARKAEGEHKQEKHNTSYVSKSGVVNNVSPEWPEMTTDTKVPTKEPWSRWLEMQQQLKAAVKRVQNTLRKPSNRIPI